MITSGRCTNVGGGLREESNVSEGKGHISETRFVLLEVVVTRRMAWLSVFYPGNFHCKLGRLLDCQP